MSRRNNVRGPHSALTSFLQEQGISARQIESRRLRYAQSTEEQAQGQLETLQQATGASSSLVNQPVQHIEIIQTNQVTGSRQSGNSRTSSKKKRSMSDDSDDENDDDFTMNTRSTRARGLSTESDLNASITCLKCRKTIEGWRFRGKSTTTASICADCTQANIKDTSVRAMRDSNTSTSAKGRGRGRGGRGRGKTRLPSEYLILNEDMTVPSLQDVCIKVVCDNIDLIESFGDIPEASLHKISRILSKHRRLTPQLLPLFTGIDRQALRLYDCTRLDADILSTIASSSPSIQELHLAFCGRMSDEVLDLYASTWRSALLTKVTLKGPYLVRDCTWANFFSKVGGQLEELHLEYAAKLSTSSFKALADTSNAHSHRSSPLRKLSLIYADSFNEACLQHIFRLTSLKLLDLRHSASFLRDEHILQLVQSLPHLYSLTLSDSQHLTDQSLTSIATLPDLQRLMLSSIVGFTEDGAREFARIREEMHIIPSARLTHLEITRCQELNSDEAILPLLKYTAMSLQYLSLNWQDKLSTEVFVVLTQSTNERATMMNDQLPVQSSRTAELGSNHSNLDRSSLQECDVSWVRCVDDDVIESMIARCPQIAVLHVFGCHRLTEVTANKEWYNQNGNKIKLLGCEF